jgi:hypothetical protein
MDPLTNDVMRITNTYQSQWFAWFSYPSNVQTREMLRVITTLESRIRTASCVLSYREKSRLCK